MKYIFTIACCMIMMMLQAQEKASYRANKINLIEVNEVVIEGHSGSDIVFEYYSNSEGNNEDWGDWDDDDEDDIERSAGLTAINSAGLKDNTGVGLSVKEENGELTVHQISANSDRRILVKVPSGVAVYYEHSTYHGDDLLIRNVDGEIEVAASYNEVKLENVSGPMSVHTVYGAIDAHFSSVNQSNPISLHSTYDHVDVTVPASTKANFRLKTSYGEMFTDLNLDVEKKEGMKSMSSDDVYGKFNGGGVDFTIKATYDNIYLRKG